MDRYNVWYKNAATFISFQTLWFFCKWYLWLRTHMHLHTISYPISVTCSQPLYHFLNAFAQMIYMLTLRDHPEKLTLGPCQMLENISKVCTTLTLLSWKTLPFRIAIPEKDIAFNQKVNVYLFWHYVKAVLYIMDIGTKYFKASFLEGHSVIDGCNAYNIGSSLVYSRLSNCFRTDSRSFTFMHKRIITSDQEVALKISDIKAHSSFALESVTISHFKTSTANFTINILLLIRPPFSN